ncbi:hypothetical protein ABEV74_21480 [Paenibacillus cisolokensis]|uniref:hypothetical protein n=1 Tax=Paenibacillus cisolokensis TaxID=1658519 RepID=UPI003D2B2C22
MSRQPPQNGDPGIFSLSDRPTGVNQNTNILKISFVKVRFFDVPCRSLCSKKKKKKRPAPSAARFPAVCTLRHRPGYPPDGIPAPATNEAAFDSSSAHNTTIGIIKHKPKISCSCLLLSIVFSPLSLAVFIKMLVF